MELLEDPPVAVKIRRMRERVAWGHPLVAARDIDQTCLALADAQGDEEAFSFLVVGDTGAGAHLGHNPQRRVAELLLKQRDGCRFLLHTGDVVYLVGSSEFYGPNFVEPYREYLRRNGGLPRYDEMVFEFPFLPVPGNHDYYDLTLVAGIVAFTTWPLRSLLRSRLDLDVGRRGSRQGRVYAKAFLDCLSRLDEDDLAAHLDRHYTANLGGRRCLAYRPGQFTRLPNRYYRFRAGGIDFFALDSNTLNAPAPLPDTREGNEFRRALEARAIELDRKRHQLMEKSLKLDRDDPDEADDLDDLRTRLQQLDEQRLDVEKQLNSDETTEIDVEQLEWLRQGLVASWQDPRSRGRVVFLHHPPYVTEATKWQQAQTLAIRRRLRRTLDRVATAVGEAARGRPLVDLMFTGHAHCLEYLTTLDTGHGDAHVPVLVCGGSGFSLRRQRPEGPELFEEGRPVATSHLFVGRAGSGREVRKPYSCLRVDVQPGNPPRYCVRPFVAEQCGRQWKEYALASFTL
jgi:3',5'-cyclic AMP phosphodiesterase CpdA